MPNENEYLRRFPEDQEVLRRGFADLAAMEDFSAKYELLLPPMTVMVSLAFDREGNLLSEEHAAERFSPGM